MRALEWLGERAAIGGVVAAAVATAACGGGAMRAREIPKGALIARAHRTTDPPATPRAAAAIQFAVAQVGKPYCWGGTGPGCFDCSGLAQTAWSYAGVRLPRTSEAMARSLPEVPLEDIRPGDILYWPGHVGLYVGSGWAVEALDHKHGVVWRAAATPYRALRPEPYAPPPYYAARR